MKAKALNVNRGGTTISVIKGGVIGLFVALVGILLFAFVLRFTSVSDKIITPVNQVIKGISIFFGVFLGLKGHKKAGLFKGSLIGLTFTLIAFVTFSVLDGAFVFDKTFVNDLFFGRVIGAICGIISNKMKKN